MGKFYDRIYDYFFKEINAIEKLKDDANYPFNLKAIFPWKKLLFNTIIISFAFVIIELIFPDKENYKDLYSIFKFGFLKIFQWVFFFGFFYLIGFLFDYFYFKKLQNNARKNIERTK